MAGDGLKIFRRTEGLEQHHELLTKLVPAQISTSPNASAAASRRSSDANIITTNPLATGSTSKNSPAPITAFDWNRVDSNSLVTSSYDTTCSVWSLEVPNKCIYFLLYPLLLLDWQCNDSIDRS